MDPCMIQQQQGKNMLYQPGNNYLAQQTLNKEFSPQQHYNDMSQQSHDNDLFKQTQSSYMTQQPQTPIPVQESQNTNFATAPPKRITCPKSKFSVSYNDSTFYVDPISLSKASSKFRELIDPYIDDKEEIKKFQLQVSGSHFTNRNMDNFFRICQKLTTDVQNCEMMQICEIAKMFGADEIYNTGADFIKQNFDPNFNVADRKCDGLSQLVLKKIVEDDEEPKKTARKEPIKIETKHSDIKSSIEELGRGHSVVYQVRYEVHTFKCPTFKLIRDNKTLYTAKQKDTDIYISEGSQVHIRKSEDHVAHIHQNEKVKENTIKTNKTEFSLRYVEGRNASQYSIEVSFPFKETKLSWVPKPPLYDPRLDKFYLCFHGEYHHVPVSSAKNIVLMNQNKKATFIVRKMDLYLYEIECMPVIDPLVAFTIGISDIVGPFMSPWENNQKN